MMIVYVLIVIWIYQKIDYVLLCLNELIQKYGYHIDFLNKDPLIFVKEINKKIENSIQL